MAAPVNATYNTDIPNPPNLPSVDVPNMKVNTNSIASVLGVDHYAFGNVNGGLHKWVQMPTVGSIPSFNSSTSNLYGKTVSGPTAQLFYSPGTSGNEYQLTRASSSNFATFAAATNGWTFLPGGLLLQYGSVASPGAGPSTVSFPFTFSSAVYSIQFTARNDGSHSAFDYYVDGAPGLSSFVYRGTTSGSDTLFWMAIGT